MKTKLLILLMAYLFIACSKEETKIPLFKKMNGFYVNFETKTDNPLDLDFDGVKNGDLYKEVPQYKQSPLVIQLFEGYGGSADEGTVSFGDPFQSVFEGQLFDPAGYYNKGSIGFGLTVTDDSILTVYPDDTPDNLRNKRARILDMQWNNDTVFCHFEKEFYTPDGWKLIDFHCKYEKQSSNTNAVTFIW